MINTVSCNSALRIERKIREDKDQYIYQLTYFFFTDLSISEDNMEH